jgi:hypothetical protein
LIEDLKEPRPNRIIIGVGDELDSISRADKRHKLEDLKDRFTTKHVYPRYIDAEMEDYADILKEYTKPQEWLGHCSGNHPLVMTTTNVDPVSNLCTRLGHPYLGYSAFVPVVVQYTTCRVNFMIMCHHGFGGANSRKEGASVNAYIDHALRYDGWDLCLFGHRHGRWVQIVPKIAPQFGGKRRDTIWVKATERIVAQTGTYLRTLSQGEYPTYSEKMGYPPKPIGCLVLKYKLSGRYPDGEVGGRQMVMEYLGSNS